MFCKQLLLRKYNTSKQLKKHPFMSYRDTDNIIYVGCIMRRSYY